MNENKGSITGKRDRMLNLKIKKAKLQLEQIFLEEKIQRLAEAKNKKTSYVSDELLEEITTKSINEIETELNTTNIEKANEVAIIMPIEFNQSATDEKTNAAAAMTVEVNSIITTNKIPEMILRETTYSVPDNEQNNLNISKVLNSENKQPEFNTNNLSKGVDISTNNIEKHNAIPLKEVEKPISTIPKYDLENNNKYPTKAEPKKEQEEIPSKPNMKYDHFKNLDTEALKERLETELDLFDEELYRINEKLKTVNYDNKTNHSRETLIKTKKELEEIEQKIKEIKRVLTNIIDRYNPSDLNKKYTETVIGELKEYLEEIKENEDEEFTNIKKDIAIIGTNYRLIDTEVNESEKKVEKNDNEVKKIKEDYDYIEKIYKDTQSLINKYNQMNTELKEKIKNMSTIKEEVEEKIKYNSHFLENIFLIYALLTMDKKNPMAKLQANMIMYCLIANMVDSMIPRRENRITLKVTYEDYRKNIQENIKNVISIREVLELSLNEIDELKEYFEKNLKDYLDDYPEYKELYRNILEIEKGIKKQLEEIKLSEELAKENEKENDQKIVMLNSLQK